MREPTIAGKKFKIKALTRKDFKKKGLKDYGYDFYGMVDAKKGKDPGEGMDRFVEACTVGNTVDRIDDLNVVQFRELFGECIKETYGAADEEKNSPSSGTASPGTKQK
jgi:hypothetical protein